MFVSSLAHTAYFEDSNHVEGTSPRQVVAFGAMEERRLSLIQSMAVTIVLG
jgi:hypothetical protein